MTIQEIKTRYEASGDAPLAIAGYTSILESNPDAQIAEQAHIERGLLHWRAGHRADAINDYNAAIRLNPQSRALQLRQAVYAVLDFYNKDLFNP